jgi:hypothetical protein
LDTLDSNPHGSPTVEAVSEAYSFISSEFGRAHKQLPEINNLEILTEHAQRHYADAILKNLKVDMLAAAGDRDRARILSCAGPKASAWLNCVPKIALFKLGSADYRVCLRLRLGLPQRCIKAGLKCRCGTVPDPLGIHHLCCPHGGHLTTRHEVICKASHEMVRAAGKESSTKGLEDSLPGFRSAKGYRLVLDQLIQSFTPDGTDVGLDFAVCHPCATSYLPHSKNNTLGAADERCGGKNSKYLAPSQANDISFRPAVMEVFGAMSQHMEGLIKECATLVKDSLPEDTITTWTAESFSAFHQQRISIALQRGNAKAIRLRAARDIHAAGLAASMDAD